MHFTSLSRRRPAWTALAFGAALSFTLLACGTSDKPKGDGDKADTSGADAGADATDDVPQADTRWTGKCAAGPAFCDDGNPCTVDDCDPQLGCSSTPKNCADDDACTIDACDIGSGACKHVTNTCDDGNACTSGTCAAGKGCVYAAKDCTDGDKCTADGCTPQSGCLNTPLVCDDGKTCTTDACDPATGCTYVKPPGAVCCESAATCEDDNACTVHACVQGICQTTAVLHCCKTDADCGDGNPCTLDTCAKATGQCTNTYQAGAGCCQSDADCDDKNACSTDVCVLGQCGHEVSCCESGADCEKAGPVGLCGASTCTEAGCAVVATPQTSCCKSALAKTGFEVGATWKQTLIAAKYGRWKIEPTGQSAASKTAQTGVGAAHYTAQSTAAPGGQNVARLILDEVTLPAGVTTKLQFWVRAQLVGGSLGDRMRLRAETPTGAWYVWQAKGSMPSFQKVEVDLRGFAARPGTRQVRLVFEVQPNAVKSAYTRVWLDNVSLSSTCKAPPSCKVDADCNDGLNATDEQCSEGICVVRRAKGYCEDKLACNDNNACTTDACNDFGCDHVPLPNCCTKSNDCLDGNPCTLNYCSGKKCKSVLKPASQCCNEAADCNDGNPCTLDQCPAAGLPCQHTQTNASCCVSDAGCDDQDSCTLDTCTNNVCGHKNQCCKTDADCDDKDPLCTKDTCVGGLCKWTPTNAKGCCEPVVLADDFEDAGKLKLTLKGTSSLAKWQVVTGMRSVSGKGALYYGNPKAKNYEDGKNSGTATSQILKLPANEALTLKFSLWMETEIGANYDKFEVWVDTPKKSVKVWDKNATGFTMKKWQAWTVNLSAWAGYDVTVRLNFDTNDSVANSTEGTYVDALRLERSCKKQTCNAVADCDDGLKGTKDACTAGVCVYTW